MKSRFGWFGVLFKRLTERAIRWVLVAQRERDDAQDAVLAAVRDEIQLWRERVAELDVKLQGEGEFSLSGTSTISIQVRNHKDATGLAFASAARVETRIDRFERTMAALAQTIGRVQGSIAAREAATNLRQRDVFAALAGDMRRTEKQLSLQIERDGSASNARAAFIERELERDRADAAQLQSDWEAAMAARVDRLDAHLVQVIDLLAIGGISEQATIDLVGLVERLSRRIQIVESASDDVLQAVRST